MFVFWPQVHKFKLLQEIVLGNYANIYRTTELLGSLSLPS